MSVKIPADFISAPMLDLSRGGATHTAPGTSDSKPEETELNSKGSKTRAGRESALQGDKPATEEQQPEGFVQKDVTNTDKERAILAANPMLHWSDVMIQSDKSNLINLRELI